jgi:hypothetical protein
MPCPLKKYNRSKPFPVADAEEDLSKNKSKAPTLAEFAAFGAERRRNALN